MGRLLAVAKPEILPFLAIGAFAGLRSAEIARLDWSEVNISRRFIEVTAAKAKTASRRIVPIVDEHRLDERDIEQLARARFANGVEQLNTLDASGLIEELFEKYPRQRAYSRPFAPVR